MDILGNVTDGLKERATGLVRLSEHTLQDVAKNPEKFRGLLSLWLTPTFKPTFVQTREQKDPDFQLLGPAVEQAPAVPRRMFDIDTGNLVDWLDSDDAGGQYCMLSHQWKGTEVTLDYIEKARRHDSEKIRATGESDAKNDVEMVYRLCEHEIEEKQKSIERFLEEANSKELAEEGGMKPRDLKQTLAARIDVNAIKWKVKGAKKAFSAAKAKLAYTELEADAFTSLAVEMEHTVLLGQRDKIEVDKKLPKARGSGINPSARDLEHAQSAVDEAQKKLNQVDKELEDSKKDDVKFFQKHSLLREAVDELLVLLEKWKSVIKIKNSMEHAKRIFDDKLFPAGEKRYLWNDTCCINKTDQNELITSLSLMGDWYANAEFCLVHLDTRKSEDNWIEEWERFEKRNQVEMEPVLPKSNYDSFDEVCKNPEPPEWSSRGWTLQELVLSKSTFYVNSAWHPLDRPVENLGPYYFLCPFLELYVGSEAPGNLEGLRGFWETTARSLKRKAPQDIKDARIKAAQNLILILGALELQVPGSIERETAIPCISQAVYLAATGMRKEVNEEGSDKLRLTHNLSVRLENDVENVFPAKDTHGRPEDDTRRVIKFLLRCLVAETKGLILPDRESIAGFGNVSTLDSWKGGTERTRFSTQKVMSLASYRTCTVETDRAYSLMGLLGVRYPTFAAEGLPRALARLFDEALILSNDVSVFNWTGREMGSHIRGRSLYPSSLEAFHADPGEGRSVALRNLRQFLERKRSGVMQTFLRVVDMLQNAIKFLKKHDHKHIPIEWISGIIEFVYEAGFEQLEPQIHHLESILAWIVNKCSRAIANKKVPAGHGKLGLPKLHRMHSDSVAEIAKNPLGSVLGLHSPFSKKRSHQNDSSPSAKRVKMEDGSHAAPTAETPSTSVPDELYDIPLLEADIKRLHAPVTDYLKTKGSPSSDGTAVPELPQDILDGSTLSNIPQIEGKKEEDLRTQGEHDMISPNPIIVNSSGIEGVFDVQRVIIMFAEEEKLWNQVENAVSPHQKITGWCGISTGFARVMVSFSCEKRILEKQLKIAQVIKKKVLNDPSRRDEGLGTELFKQMIHLEEKKQSEEKEGCGKGEKVEHTEEERKVTRMIAFIEEEHLEAIAGEWVLAKFSDVEGAQWFLCSLELGSTHGFYGHRIPTDKIDFDDAIPEPGLLNVWQAYMSRKKRKLCYVLSDYLVSRKMGSARDLIFKEGHEHDDSESTFSHLLELGKMAGNVTSLSLMEGLFELKADYLDKHLTASVLKYTPKELQPAVENLNADGDFRPTMSHYARRIHMF